MTEVEARVALVSRSLTGGTNLLWMMADCIASGSRPCINGTHKRQKFSS